jgi:RNA polymerase sigma factor (sigma-70 family)
MSHPSVRDYLRATLGDTSGAADAELLARFAATRDEAAFELFVWRHAALVQCVCRAVLRDHHAAEDAAQAAFLIVARKAHTFAGRGSAVGWLYRVARRVAVRLAKDRARRAVNAVTLEHVPAPIPDTDRASPDEIAAVCEEVDRLPEHYRVPVLLCFFEGLTHAEAARRTGWPVGSVAGRLARAKEVLARRLSRRGVGLPAVVLGVPAGSFVGGTAQAATAFAVRGPVVPGVEPSVIQLAEGVTRAMTTSTWKMTAAAVAVLCGLSAGVWGIAAPAQPAAAPAAQPDKPKPALALAAEPPDGKRVATAAQRALSMNNLKQILIAMHGYHDTHGKFPADITDKDGKPLLSWRVAILPYIEQERLYKQFKLDEPWDSENNKKLLAQMPVTYRVGFQKKGETKTYYQGFAGPGTVFERGKAVKLEQIADGTSNTIGVIEAGPPVEWAQPGDIPYDPKKPLVGMGGPFTNVVFAAHCDGAAYAYRRDLDETTLRHLIETNDGNPVNTTDAFAKFPLTAEDIKSAQEMLRKNEILLTAIAEQFREQQKLLAEAGKKGNPLGVVNGIDVGRLTRMQEELEGALNMLKRQTDELRKELEGKKPDGEKPPPPTPSKPAKR